MSQNDKTVNNAPPRTELSTFARVRTALGLFLSALLGLIVAHYLRLPTWATELSISVIAAVTVGLLDRLWLYKDTQQALNTSIDQTVGRQTAAIANSLDKLERGLPAAVEKQVEQLATKSTILTQQSLDKIQAGIESTISSQMGSLQAMTSAGIERIYSSRSGAADDLYNDLDFDGSDGDRNIRIIGISLNDFVLAKDSRLGRVWERIEGRLRNPHARSSSQKKSRLTIKILLIDSRCFGAELRSQGEQRRDAQRHGHDQSQGSITARLATV